jgi:hypothetical protein
MSTILLVEDVPDLALYEARLLTAQGHHVIRCSGGPTPFSACPMIRDGVCRLVDAADIIVFACQLYMPIPRRTYRGIHLLRAYRDHPIYGRLPMLVVAFGAPADLGGSGPIETLKQFSEPHEIVEAVDRLLAGTRVTAKV